MNAQGTVLVTGGSGIIGSGCVIGLLQQGYAVASQVVAFEPKDPDGLVAPARDGTRRECLDESTWTDLGDPPIGALPAPGRWPSTCRGT